MNNIKQSQLVKCILLTPDEFEIIVKDVINIPLHIDYTLEGLDIYPADETNYDVGTDVLKDKLAKYFDVKEITSIHLDHDEMPNVWIAYKENDIEEVEEPLYDKSKYHFQDDDAGYLSYDSEKRVWLEYNDIPCKTPIDPHGAILPEGRYVIMFTDPIYYDIYTGQFTHGKETQHMTADKIDRKFIVNYFAVNTPTELKKLINEILDKDITHGMWGWIMDSEKIITANQFVQSFLPRIKETINNSLDEYFKYNYS